MMLLGKDIKNMKHTIFSICFTLHSWDSSVVLQVLLLHVQSNILQAKNFLKFHFPSGNLYKV